MIPSVLLRLVGFFFSGSGNRFVFLVIFQRITMDDITQGWNNLSLIDREEDDVKLRRKGHSEEFALMARFLTSKALSMDAVARTFNPI